MGVHMNEKRGAIVQLKGRKTATELQTEDEQEQQSEAAWSQEISAFELIGNRKGSMLIGALMGLAKKRGHDLQTLARRLEVTHGYLGSLRNGNKEIDKIGDDVLEKCAEYLGTPRMVVLMLAAQLTPADLYTTVPHMAMDLARAMEFIKSDPEWYYLLTPQVIDGDLMTQYLVVRLYEKAADKKLLVNAIDPVEVGKAIEELQKQASVEAALLHKEAGSAPRKPGRPRKTGEELETSSAQQLPSVDEAAEAKAGRGH
jgi:hypothetical protein